ncbi:MAG TPA: hypothetical protein VG347_04190 [Verrucomicrobiae bacterium]|nr:hypothetical protein [Verrucomicrobiae bacterium]
MTKQYCPQCQDELEQGRIYAGLCGWCNELENNRRYRQHHKLGEYAPEPDEPAVTDREVAA